MRNDKRNPVKQIMSNVHRDVRASRVDLAGHDDFMAEVKRRLRAAGLPEDQLHRLKANREAKAETETSRRDIE